MLVEVSFVVQLGDVPSHHTDRRFSKRFEVGWSGCPRPGDAIYLDLAPPVTEHDFVVGGVAWNVQTESKHFPTAPDANVWCERVVAVPEVEWEGGIDGYRDYAKKSGWSDAAG